MIFQKLTKSWSELKEQSYYLTKSLMEELQSLSAKKQATKSVTAKYKKKMFHPSYTIMSMQILVGKQSHLIVSKSLVNSSPLRS